MDAAQTVRLAIVPEFEPQAERLRELGDGRATSLFASTRAMVGRDTPDFRPRSAYDHPCFFRASRITSLKP